MNAFNTLLNYSFNLVIYLAVDDLLATLLIFMLTEINFQQFILFLIVTFNDYISNILYPVI